MKALNQLRASERTVAFLTGWTRKEADLKAIGQGLTRPPSHVDVYLRSSESVAVYETAGSLQGGRYWRIETLVPAPGYLGAVAAEGIDWHVRWSQCSRAGQVRRLQRPLWSRSFQTANAMLGRGTEWREHIKRTDPIENPSKQD